MTLGEACLQAKRSGDQDRRRRVYSQAIRRGVTYRRLARFLGISHSALHYLLSREDTSRSDPLAEPYWEET